MARRESLRTAIAKFHRGGTGYSRSGLAGCPVGGWPETAQALRQLEDALPLRSQRSYTVSQFVAAVYEEDSTGRYRVRESV